jgi:hypothetical protein
LSRWSRNDYQVTFFTSVFLTLGGNPYRCEYCRVNFVSFRKRKERYDPRKRKQARKHGESAGASGASAVEPQNLEPAEQPGPPGQLGT